MKNQEGKKAPKNPVNEAFKAKAEGEKASSVTLNQKHHKKPKKIYE